MDAVVAMTEAYAREISNWSYPGSYALYSFAPTEETVAELMGGGYYACLAQGRLVGYFCFGQPARIPVREQQPLYQQEALDFGLGMCPDCCGQGRGTAFMQTGLDFAQDRFHPKKFRLVVAGFNARAIHLYEKLGFCKIAELTHQYSGMPFWMMEKQAASCELPDRH